VRVGSVSCFAREEIILRARARIGARRYHILLLADATQANPIATDDYFARRQPKSVLCLPIMRQSALIGLLYLENNLTAHAFTSDRVAVLEMLASSWARSWATASSRKTAWAKAALCAATSIR
jgi:GAF domain-containing protein